MKARLLIYAKIFLAAVIVGAYAIAFHYGHRVSELEKRVAGLEFAEHLRNFPPDTVKYDNGSPDTIYNFKH